MTPNVRDKCASKGDNDTRLRNSQAKYGSMEPGSSSNCAQFNLNSIMS